MTEPAWVMIEYFGSQCQRQRCARACKRACKGAQWRARACKGVQGRVILRAATHCAFSPNFFHRKGFKNLEHMTKPAWMMTECFGSQRQRQRCARARKRASNAEGGHTLCFFSIFVSRAYNSKIYQPNEFPRIQKNHPLKSF